MLDVLINHVTQVFRTLPFKPTPDNTPDMKSWLLNYFGATTFNTCPDNLFRKLKVLQLRFMWTQMPKPEYVIPLRVFPCIGNIRWSRILKNMRLLEFLKRYHTVSRPHGATIWWVFGNMRENTQNSGSLPTK